MRLRRKRFRLTVSVQPGDYPIVIGAGPALKFRIHHRGVPRVPFGGAQRLRPSTRG
jgi:hypothetical protein